MSPHSLVETVCKSIDNEVSHLQDTTAFREWINGISAKAGDIIVFNNSFLYRDKAIETSKNERYLCVKIGADNKPMASTLVAQSGKQTMPFKKFSASNADKIGTENLDFVLKRELAHLGLVVRALIGRIGADEPTSIGLPDSKDWNVLRYEPEQPSLAELSNGEISVNRVDDLDIIWKAVSDGIDKYGLKVNQGFSEIFERKFSELREKAFRPVDIDDISMAGPSILGEVVKHLESQVRLYGRALKNHLADANDGESFNELLRVAYNFADGTQGLMRLAIGICDMKPVVFWLTICDQFLLADRFGNLPFSIIGKGKPSLTQYRTIIAGARNRAFHDTYSFGQPFRVRLRSDAFQEAELRLFRNYTSKAPVLDYEDRNLVTLLESLTRPGEKPVPLGFWEANLEVMEAVASLARSLHRGLLLATQT